MYKLRIKLNTEDDITYKCNLLNNKTETTVDYNYRPSAIINIKSFYSQLINSINSTKECNEETINFIKYFKDYLFIITDKLNSFLIRFDLNNIDFEIELRKINEDCVIINVHKNFEQDFGWNILNAMTSISDEADDLTFRV